jgi:hypothetical protein
MGVWKSAAVGVMVVAILSSLPGTLSAQDVESGCPCCWEGTPAFDPDSDCSEGEVSDFATSRRECLDNVDNTYSECQKRCNPVVAGRCTFIRGCLDGCRRDRTRQTGICWRIYKKLLRQNCGPGFREVQKSLRKCKRGRPLPFEGACDCVAPPPVTTTSTTSTTTGNTASTTTTTTSTTTITVLTGTSTTSTTISMSGMGSASKLERGTTAQVVNCQTACVNQIVIQCYRDCKHSCGVDFEARKKCNRFCRDANCRFLRLKCTDNDAPESGDYRACCNAAGTCGDEKDGDDLCEVTTTTTSSTSTTTTAPSTTTTSSFNPTLTTSTSTIGVNTTTTSTLIVGMVDRVQLAWAEHVAY